MELLRRIGTELRSHAPFTLFGALTGIVIMTFVVLVGVRAERLRPVFEGLHGVHIFLSALVTTGLYRRYRTGLVASVLVGFVGAVGIATLSDVIFPHHGAVLALEVTGLHAGAEHLHLHIPFIEHWWLINPVALAGVAVALGWPKTKFPHAGHVLLSTWASLFYILSHAPMEVNWLPRLPLVFGVLFVAVWVPCCFSDIVFPLLFVGPKGMAEHAHQHGEEHEHDH